jgi:hypothetical protein
MAAVPYAHVVAKIIGGKHPKGTDISLAPNPKDIVRFHSMPCWFCDFSFFGSLDLEEYGQNRY